MLITFIDSQQLPGILVGGRFPGTYADLYEMLSLKCNAYTNTSFVVRMQWNMKNSIFSSA